MDHAGGEVAEQRLRALLVVSRVTFVPDNYDQLVCTLATCPQIAGLLILDNGTPQLAVQAMGLMFLGVRRMGMTLLRNALGRSDARRRRAYAHAGKPVWRLHTINCPEAVELVRREGIDLLVNARTRYLYRSEILTAPRLGCINIHHGLLPEQRGMMCDLWAAYEQRPTGFSIHQMSSKIDDGGIIRRVPVSVNDRHDYPAYLRCSTACETTAIREVLAKIEERDAVITQPNVQASLMPLYRQPTPAQIRAMRKGGMLL